MSSKNSRDVGSSVLSTKQTELAHIGSQFVDNHSSFLATNNPDHLLEGLTESAEQRNSHPHHDQSVKKGPSQTRPQFHQIDRPWHRAAHPGSKESTTSTMRRSVLTMAKWTHEPAGAQPWNGVSAVPSWDTNPRQGGPPAAAPDLGDQYKSNGTLGSGECGGSNWSKCNNASGGSGGNPVL